LEKVKQLLVGACFKRSPLNPGAEGWDEVSIHPQQSSTLQYVAELLPLRLSDICFACTCILFTCLLGHWHLVGFCLLTTMLLWIWVYQYLFQTMLFIDLLNFKLAVKILRFWRKEKARDRKPRALPACPLSVPLDSPSEVLLGFLKGQFANHCSKHDNHSITGCMITELCLAVGNKDRTLNEWPSSKDRFRPRLSLYLWPGLLYLCYK
jgi:hypothetical protein